MVLLIKNGTPNSPLFLREKLLMVPSPRFTVLAAVGRAVRAFPMPEKLAIPLVRTAHPTRLQGCGSYYR